MYRGPNGKTIAELKPIVGDRFRITPGGDDWWEVVKVVERGVVVELWGTHGHFTLWENDMVAYPV